MYIAYHLPDQDDNTLAVWYRSAGEVGVGYLLQQICNSAGQKKKKHRQTG
jgi:hypothetical protein